MKTVFYEDIICRIDRIICELLSTMAIDFPLRALMEDLKKI